MGTMKKQNEHDDSSLETAVFLLKSSYNGGFIFEPPKRKEPIMARRKILCKRFSTKSRMALESRADSGLNPLITESHGGQNGMRAGTA